VSAAGFEDGEIVYKYDNYVDVPDPSDALEFGTRGISFRARKPSVEARTHAGLPVTWKDG
jgi:hypothetical protein